jgi:ABC-type transport system involved in multi-copper enzyme maturation permease subunit
VIWLTWPQHRKQALFTGIGLAVLAALMIPTGLAMHHAFESNNLAACVSALGHTEPSNDSCNTAIKQFNNQFHTLAMVGPLFIFLPLLVGLFWGAPLVAREIEQGTHRLVWLQGISRRHWALVKFGLVGTATLAISAGYGLGMSWWLTPLSQLGNSRFAIFAFDMQGLAPIGYTLFAVTLGIYAGTIWHKVLPAMGVTLAGFLGLRIALTILARPRYLPAHTLTFTVQGTTGQPDPYNGDWILSNEVRDATGKLVMANAQAGCPPNDESCGGLGAGAYNWQLYQPASRFWLFQGIETGIFVALAVLLLYLAIRRIRRIT